MISVVLLLGGNVGCLKQTFSGVRDDLEREVGRISSSSELFISEAWGFRAEVFSNQAVILITEMTPEQLLDATQRIEERWGRDREREQQSKELSGERYSSRTIDIDIIFYGDHIIQSERLVVPHPLMEERLFVLEPIAQIAPTLCHPQSGKSVVQMLNEKRAVEL